MEIKSPIAKLHSKELNVGFFTSAKSGSVLIIAILLLLVISYFVYKYYSKKEKK